MLILARSPHWAALEVGELFAALLGEGHSDLLFLIVVEVAGVARTFALRDEGSFDL